MTLTDPHGPEQFYWPADSGHCPHGPEPDPETEGEAWDVWRDRHPASDDGPICLDAPADVCCPTCSAEHGAPVPWGLCEGREHIRPARGVAPTPEPEHQPVPVWVGSLECLERECSEYFTEDGDEIPGLEKCSHVREETSCSCRRLPDGSYSLDPCSAFASA